MKTVTVQFTRTYTVKALDGATYQAGSVHVFDEASARHFLNRGVATLADKPRPKAKPEGFATSSTSRSRLHGKFTKTPESE